MIVMALNKAGGVSYLVRQSEENPKAFMALVGRVVPVKLVGNGENGSLDININDITSKFFRPLKKDT